MNENTKDINVVYFARLHWIIFFWPITSLFLTLGLAAYTVQFREPTLVFSAASLVWIAMTWVTYYFSSLTIKKRQVIVRTGVIVRQTIDVPLSKIETIDIRQTILGSLFRYGTLIIIGTGGTRQLINFLQRPLTCRRYIEQLMNEQ
jgi:uncharacterized membrane protein YdbT with pleckstrin-like domain